MALYWFPCLTFLSFYTLTVMIALPTLAYTQIHICKFRPEFNQTITCNFNSIGTSVAKITSDSYSIPIVDYGYIHGVYVGPQRNPVTVGEKAISYYEIFRKTHSQSARESLIENVNWLVENAKSMGNYSILEYKFPYPPYKLKSDWRSGMAQGQALEASLDAYAVTGEKKYLTTARLILNSFFVEVKDGGVTLKTPVNGWWYEEYAANDSRKSGVLNGMMYTLISIYKYFNSTHSPEAKYLFDMGVLALDRNLPKYDNYGYSNYDLIGTPATIQYHHIHVELLGKLYNITKDEIFKAFHDRWGSYRTAKLTQNSALSGKINS